VKAVCFFSASSSGPFTSSGSSGTCKIIPNGDWRDQGVFYRIVNLISIYTPCNACLSSYIWYTPRIWLSDLINACGRSTCSLPSFMNRSQTHWTFSVSYEMPATCVLPLRLPSPPIVIFSGRAASNNGVFPIFNLPLSSLASSIFI
jgi:hypothetical protein